MPQQRKFFPGWLVVASGFVIMATCYTIFVNCMSLFQPLIVSDLGISLAQYNVSNAISTVVSVVGSLVIGHVADKVSGRVLGSLTVIATSAVLAGMSFVGELWQAYVLFAVSGCFAVASTRLLISLVTANWFTAKRGLAISIALSGSGFGGAILSPIVSSLIVSVGWRSAFLVLAAVCMVAALPITAYSFRTKPSEIGLKPLGENPGDPSVSTAGDKDEHTAPEVSVGWSRIKKSPAFWLLVVAFLFMGLVNGAILPNQVTNMTSVTVNGAKIVTGGHDPMWAGTVLSAYMVTVVIAKISLGAIYDRFGLRFGNILGSIACIIACVALCFPATDLGSHRGCRELWCRNVHGHYHAYHCRVQAVWHGRPRQGHGHHHLARDGRRHRGRYCLGRAVRCHGLLCEHLDRVPGVLRGHARVPAGIRAHRRQAARERGGGVGRPKRIAACPLRPRRRVWPNESPYPRSVRRAAAVCVCAV